MFSFHYASFLNEKCTWFVIKTNDNDDITDVKLSINTTIIKVKKENLKVTPIHFNTGPSRTWSTEIHLPSLDQLIIYQVYNNNNNQLQTLS